MALSKKQIIVASAIGLVTISGAALYIQYNRLMDYVISLKKYIVRSVAKNLVVVDLYLIFENKSKLNFDVKSQSYDVYINNVKVATAKNNNVTQIKSGKNDLSLRVSFNPEKFFKDAGGALGLLSIASSGTKNIVKFDIKLNVNLWKFIPLSIPFVYETTIAELIAPKK